MEMSEPGGGTGPLPVQTCPYCFVSKNTNKYCNPKYMPVQVYWEPFQRYVVDANNCTNGDPPKLVAEQPRFLVARL